MSFEHIVLAIAALITTAAVILAARIWETNRGIFSAMEGETAAMSTYGEYEPWWRTILGGAGRGLIFGIVLVVVLVVVFFLATWGYHEWWVSQHCTMVLGTQVCQ